MAVELHLRPGATLRVLLAAIAGLGLAGLASAYVHHVLGWRADRYQAWLAHTLQASLLLDR